MKVIVTTNNIDYSDGGYLKVPALKDVVNLIGVIDVLVFNNSIDSPEDRIKYLTSLSSRVSKLIYVASKDNIDMTVKIFVLGSGGKYFEDEFFISDCNELNNLVNSLDEVLSIVSLGGVEVVTDFLNKYLKNGGSSNPVNKNYLMAVKDSVTTMITEYNKKSSEVVQLSEMATKVFSDNALRIAKMSKESERLQSSVTKLTQNLQSSGISGFGGSSLGAITYFPRVNYLKSKSILRVKGFNGSLYGLSFLMGFRAFLETTKYLKVRLIVLLPLGNNYSKLYKGYNFISKDNYSDNSLYVGNIVFTNHPTIDVVTKLLDEGNKDVCIVYDLTNNDFNHILNCKGALLYITNSLSILKMLKVKNNVVISSGVDMGGYGYIPNFSDYPTDVALRERYYMSKMTNLYTKMSVGLV